MEATQAQLISLLDGKKQFTIPIYQRTYSWHQKQCYQLFEDIIKVGSDTLELTHFIGSIVYFKPGTSPVTSVPDILVEVDDLPLYNQGEERCKVFFEFDKETIRVITKDCSMIYAGCGVYFDGEYKK